MRLPGLSGVADAINSFTSPRTTTTTLSDPPNFAEVPGKRRQFDLGSAFLVASGSPGRTQPEERDAPQQLAERQTCASGLVFYACGNGFRGCCATNACNGDDGCPASALSISTTAATKAVVVQNSRTSTSISFATLTTVGGSSTGVSTSSRTVTSVLLGSPLSQPATSTSPSTSSSTSSATSSASATSTSNAEASNGGGSNVGAIAGGAVGGVAGLVLILALIAFFTRRHRRKVDERRANRERDEEMKKAVFGNFNNDMPAHNRSRSTGNDVFTPGLGGSTISPPSTAFISPPSTAKTADFSELEGHSSMSPGARAERGRGIMPAAVLRPPQMLDGTPVTPTPPKRPSSHGSTSRSSVFREHISEMEDTSTAPSRPATSRQISSPLESPVLGRPFGNKSTTSLADETRRKQHLMSWNNYDAGQATAREEGMMSATIGTPKTPPSARKEAAGPPLSPPSQEALPTLQPTVYQPGKEKKGKEVKRGWSLRRGKGS